MNLMVVMSNVFYFSIVGNIDVGQNLHINLCNLLFLVFLCNYCYFRFRAFISSFLGVLMFFTSNLVPVLIRY